MDSFPPILLRPQLFGGWERGGHQFYFGRSQHFWPSLQPSLRVFPSGVGNHVSACVTTMLNSKKFEELGKIKRSGEGEGKRSRNIRQQSILDSSLCYIERVTPNKYINEKKKKTCSHNEASKLTQVNLDPVLLPSFWGQLLELAHPELQSTTALLGIWLWFH